MEDKAFCVLMILLIKTLDFKLELSTINFNSKSPKTKFMLKFRNHLTLAMI